MASWFIKWKPSSHPYFSFLPPPPYKFCLPISATLVPDFINHIYWKVPHGAARRAFLCKSDQIILLLKKLLFKNRIKDLHNLAPTYYSKLVPHPLTLHPNQPEQLAAPECGCVGTGCLPDLEGPSDPPDHHLSRPNSNLTSSWIYLPDTTGTLLPPVFTHTAFSHFPV